MSKDLEIAPPPYRNAPDSITDADSNELTKWTNIAIARFRDYEDKLPNPSLDRMHSWSECYEFFRDNLSKLATPGLDLSSPLLEEATLRLAAYLASFGMYVRNARLLQCSKNVLKFPLLEIFHEIGRHRCDWFKDDPSRYAEDIAENPKALVAIAEIFSKKTDDAFQKAGAGTQASLSTLRSKVLLGVFAATPGFDRKVKESLKCWKATNISLLNAVGEGIAESSFEAWIELGKKLEQIPAFHELEVKTSSVRPCPTMRKLDLLLWAYSSEETTQSDKSPSKAQK